ncbi:MAG: flagellar hook-associated protein FlgK [Anaerolineales bacterium]|nr:flagellar hook-associated protein FlgK [Anaerolineales bacterium]
MSSLLSSIHIALSSILSQQQAIQVIDHNVANANTPGYHRQEAVMSAGIPYGSPGMYTSISSGQLGTGVRVETIRRASVELFNHHYRKEIGDASRYEMQEQVLQQVEAVMAEMSDDGLINKLDEFWSGWYTLSSDPSSSAYRSQLLMSSQALVDGLNRRAMSLEMIRRDQDVALQQRVDEINEKAAQVAGLNVQISNVLSVGDSPNDLLDERDRILESLSELAGASVSIEESGQALVSIGGHAMVIGKSTFSIETYRDAGNDSLLSIRWEDGNDFDPPTGEVLGILDARDNNIVDQLDDLNELAAVLISEVNNIHSTGYGTNNATGLDFFLGTDALSIEVNSVLEDLESIGAASGADQPGDGSIALVIAQLDGAEVMDGGTTTMNDFYTGTVADLGLALGQAKRNASDRRLVASALGKQRESVVGVSLDEEAANLISAQKSFEAAARLMTAIDEMLDTVINGMGVVGR